MMTLASLETTSPNDISIRMKIKKNDVKRRILLIIPPVRASTNISPPTLIDTHRYTVMLPTQHTEIGAYY